MKSKIDEILAEADDRELCDKIYTWIVDRR
jgi:hypothetical protein